VNGLDFKKSAFCKKRSSREWNDSGVKNENAQHSDISKRSYAKPEVQSKTPELQSADIGLDLQRVCECELRTFDLTQDLADLCQVSV